LESEGLRSLREAYVTLLGRDNIRESDMLRDVNLWTTQRHLRTLRDEDVRSRGLSVCVNKSTDVVRWQSLELPGSIQFPKLAVKVDIL
jgi:hypothetical protein